MAEAVEAYRSYQQRRNEHPDNQRMSKLRRGPGEDDVERLRSQDEYGPYYVVDCNFDSDGNWHCKHHYHAYPCDYAWHMIYKNGGHYFQNPDGTQSYYRPHKPWQRWKRAFKQGPKVEWSGPRTNCVASVNPPPRWWVEENRITPFPGQNELADDLDQRFANAPGSSTRQTNRRAHRAYDFDDTWCLDPYGYFGPYEPYDPYNGDPGWGPSDHESDNDPEEDDQSEPDEDDKKPKDEPESESDVEIKQEPADDLDDSTQRNRLESSQTVSASPTAVSMNSASAHSSRATRQTTQRKGKQAAVAQNKSVETPGSGRKTRSSNEASTSGQNQSTNPKPASSRKRKAEEDEAQDPTPKPSRKRRAEVDDEPQAKKSRRASKRQDYV